MPTVDHVERHLEVAYHILDELMPTLTPERLATPTTFRGRGQSRVLVPWTVLRHIVNHATYHRGWVSDLFFQVPAKPPTTDWNVFLLAERASARE